MVRSEVRSVAKQVWYSIVVLTGDPATQNFPESRKVIGRVKYQQVAEKVARIYQEMFDKRTHRVVVQ